MFINQKIDVAKFRNVEGYENMFGKQIEIMLSTLYSPKPAPKPIKTYT